ncbi:MAG: phosphoserine phosphatase SerB [SAR324 cluster bacterium]|nr:phosphoserine phosphatase SerB [SAR324 cluster bacterium]MBL7036092.1 phosphoserine phosphatase SerB [SAR324 cluster bacterium]
MSETQSFLVTVQGPTAEQDVLEHFMEQLEDSSFSISALHYLNCQSALSLLMHLELSDSADLKLLTQELHQLANKFQLELLISPLQNFKVTPPAHRYILTLLSQQLRPELLTKLFRYLRDKQLRVTAVSPLDADNLHVFEIKIHADQPIDRQRLMQELLQLKSEHQLDLALQSDDLFRRNKRLIFLDADMTFIQCEMIDDMSRLSGKETEVAEITHRAMEGEIDFKDALRQRVALLKGVRLSDLERLILNIPYTPGVERLVYILKTLGYQIGIVSGGFTRVIDHIKQRFELDYGFANTLEVKNGELTGQILGEILDGHQKGVILREVARKEKLLSDQVIAVGDGANDLEMLSSASLGIAFNAKLFLRERAAGSLSLPNLDALLYFLGISRHEVNALFQQEQPK